MKTTLFVLLTFASITASAQQIKKEYPKIGDTCPNFIFNPLEYGHTKKASMADFRGKPVIIDFFALGCSACFESFPHVDSMKKAFEGKVQFIIIGRESPALRKQYENYRKHYHLDVPLYYDDSTIFNQVGVWTVPYTIWVDSQGIIKQITNAQALDSDRIANLLRGKPQKLRVMPSQSEMEVFSNNQGGKYNRNKPLLINGNGGSDSSFIYRSVLSKWQDRIDMDRDLFISSKNQNRIQEIAVDLNMLINLAYGDTVDFLSPRNADASQAVPNHFGGWALFPVIESKNSKLFDSDFNSARNYFNYNLILPDSSYSAATLQKSMQRDIKNCFSIEAFVETRKMPYWKITTNKNLNPSIRSVGGDPVWTETFSGFDFKNQSTYNLMFELWYHSQLEIFEDETSIDYPIDLSINAVMFDMADVRRALEEKGFDLIKSEKYMKVIVVKDVRN